MEPRTFVLIANPHAGRGRAVGVLQRAGALLRDAGADVRLELTSSIGHARELAAEAAAAGRVAVAVGGDGLVRAVAAGASEHAGTIGVVPAGRGNDFARTAGITKDVPANVALLLTAEPRPTDCLAIGDEVALGSVCLGFDSLSNALANDLRWNLGQFSYVYAALRVALSMPALRIDLTVDGVSRSFTGIGVTVASSVYYGGGVPVAPPADIHDGLLDVITFEQRGRLSRIPALLALRRGSHLRRDDVHHLRGRVVEVGADRRIEAYCDGDPVAHPPYTVRVLPGAIGLLAPA